MTASRDFLCASWLQPLPSIQDSPASSKLQQKTVHGDEDFFTSRGFFSELAVVFSLEKQDRKTTNSSQFGLYNETVLKKEEEKNPTFLWKEMRAVYLLPGVEDQPGR